MVGGVWGVPPPGGRSGPFGAWPATLGGAGPGTRAGDGYLEGGGGSRLWRLLTTAACWEEEPPASLGVTTATFAGRRAPFGARRLPLREEGPLWGPDGYLKAGTLTGTLAGTLRVPFGYPSVPFPKGAPWLEHVSA